MKFKIVEDFILESKEDWEKFEKWIKDNGVSEEKTNELISQFKVYKQKFQGQEKDIYYWMNKPITDFLEKMEAFNIDTKSKKDKENLIKEGAQLLYKDDEWYVYNINNYEASCKYGANTKWCITGSKRWLNNQESGDKYWKDYKEKNIDFYFFINRKENTKYALAVYQNKKFEIFNAEDLEIAYIPNAPIIKSIGVNYWENDEQQLLQNLFMSNKIPHSISFGILEDIITNEKLDGSGDCTIFDNPNEAIEYTKIYIPDNYIEHTNVENGILTPKEYENITKEEYDDFWGGDLPMLDYADYDNLVGDMTTKSDVFSNKNPFFKDNKYWVVMDNESTEIFGYDSWERLIRDCVFNSFDNEPTVDEFMGIFEDYLSNYLQDKQKYNELLQLGLSKEYLDKLKRERR